MRRIMVVLAMVAMLVVAAIPAIAQEFEGDGVVVVDDGELFCLFFPEECEEVFFDDGSGSLGQEFSQEDVESGDVEPVVDISNTGSNVNLCPTVVQSANSGNVQNAQGVVQYQSGVDDIEFEGSSIEIASEVEAECVQTIDQAVAVSAW